MTDEIRTMEEKVRELQAQESTLCVQANDVRDKKKSYQKELNALRAKYILDQGLLKLFNWVIGNFTYAQIIKGLKPSPEYKQNLDKLHVAAGWNGERIYLPLEGGLTLTLGESDETPCIVGPDGESNNARRKLAVVQFMVKHGLNIKDVEETLKKQLVSLEKSIAATKEELAVLKGEKA